MKSFYKFFIVGAFLIFSLNSQAQNNSVAIGTNSTDPSAVLLLVGNGSQGLILPITSNLSGFGKEAMVVYNKSDKKIYYHDGNAWNTLGGAGSASQSISISGNTITVGSGANTSISLASNPQANQFFMWNGTSWVGTSLSGDVSNNNGTITVTGVQGKTITLPTSGVQYLAYDATQAKWVFQTLSGSGGGTVTSVATGTGLSGGPITTTGTIALSNTTVTAGSYGTTTSIPQINVDAQGRLTAASNVSIPTANTSTTGLLTNTDWNTFNGKVSLAGDLGGTASAPTVSKIQGSSWPANASGVLTNNGSGTLSWSATGGTGTVQSVGLTMPSIFSVTGSPITTTGTLAATLTSQSANSFFAAPNGTSGTPTFRVLVAADIPSLSASQIVSGTLPVAVGGTGASSLSGLIVGNGTSPFTAITTGSNGQILTVNAGVPSWQNAPSASGTAGGDLSGTYPNPTIASGAVTSAKLAANAVATTNIAANAVDDTKILSVAPGKLTQAAATSGQVLKWNGSAWAPAADNVGGGSAPTLSPGQIIVGDGTNNSAATLSLDATLNSTNGNITVQGLQGRPISTTVPATNSVYQYNGTQWAPVVLSGGGTVSQVNTGTGLTGGPISSTGTISIAAGGVTSTELANSSVDNTKIASNAVSSTQIIDGSIADADINSAANIAVTKLATGTNGQVLTVNAGVPSWQTPSGLTNPMNAAGDIIYGGVGGSPTRLATATGFLKGGTTPSYSSVNLASTDVSGTLPLTAGGTGATTATAARTNLGLGTLATLSAVTTTEITDGTIANVDISNTAAIAGSKITPAFGSQNISTTGTLSSGAATVTGLTVSGSSTTLNNKTYIWPNNPTLVAGTFLQTDASGNLSWAPVVGGVGTVTSVGLSMPSIFTVTNSPVVTSGTLTATLNSQTANTFLAAPNGTTGTPTFRTLVAADVPALDASKITTGTLPITQGGTGATTAAGALANLGAVSLGGDLGGTNTSPTVSKIQGSSWPANAAGVLTNNGTGTLSWNPAGSGTVTSVTGTAPITVATGTTTPVISLANTAVTAGTYGTSTSIPQITVDAQGRLTAASNVAIPTANTTTTGLLLNTDWNTFNGKMTNPMTTAGDLIYGGSSGVPTRLATGTGFLKGGAIPSYAAINLASSTDITGALPLTNGGTGATTATAARTNLGLGTLATLSTVTTTEILDGTIADIDVSASANINGSKINPTFGAQAVSTTSTLTTGSSGQFAVDANGNIIKINNITTSFPVNQGAANTVLTNDGAGNLTWGSLSSSSWSLSGNSGTTAGTNFIGTTDANDLVLKTNGVENMRIANTSGLVGIGTSGPITKLNVTSGNWDMVGSNGDFAIGDATYSLKMGVSNAGGGAGDAYIASSGGTNRLFLGTAQSSATTQTLTLQGGKVGIGTIAPQNTLDVSGGLAVGSSYGGTSIAPTDGAIFQGNVGIGTPSPTAKFQVQNGTAAPGSGNGIIEVHTANGNGSAIYADFSIGGDGTGTVYSRGTISGYDANPTGTNNTGVWGHQFGNGSGGWGLLATNGSSVTSPTTYAALGGTVYSGIFFGGNVGIGTTSPAYDLDVSGNIKASGQYYFNGTSASNSTYKQYIGAVSGSYVYITDHFIPNLGNQQDLGTATYRWRTIYTNNTVNVSDSRLKKNINLLNYGLKEILALRPVSYVMKDDKQEELKLGLIAQEVQRLIPEVVSEDNSSKEKYLGMNYTELVPVLIKAMQEQQELIDEQKRKIQELEYKVQKESKAQLELNQLRMDIDSIKRALGQEVKASTKK